MSGMQVPHEQDHRETVVHLALFKWMLKIYSILNEPDIVMFVGLVAQVGQVILS